MEAAKPITITSDENDGKNIDFLEEIPIKKQNEEFVIKLGIITNINKLILKAFSNSSKNIYYFQNEYSQEEIKNISKIFLMYETIKDIIQFLKTLKFELMINDNILSIKFNIFLPNGNSQLIELKLKKYFNDKDNIIQNLYEENIYLKSEINFLKEDNKKLWEEINNLKKILQNNQNQNQNAKDKNNDNFDSKIVSKENINFILNYINENDKLFSFKSLNLLFRGSQDGDDTKLLHEKCDLKKNILILIKSDKNKIFGGYCKIGFKSQKTAEYKIDNNCFLFSVDLKKIYPVIENTKPICYIDSSFGLSFYSCLVFYNGFMNNKKGIVCTENNKYFTGFLNNYEMNDGVQHFKCKELEIFQLT